MWIARATGETDEEKGEESTSATGGLRSIAPSGAMMIGVGD